MFKPNLILLLSFFLIFACGETTKNKHEQKKTESLQISESLANNKPDTIPENNNFDYGDDATISNEAWEEDTLFGGISPKLIDTANFAYQLRPSGNYNKVKNPPSKKVALISP